MENEKNTDGTRFNFGIVGRSDSLESYDLLKKTIENVFGVSKIYERTSREKLFITKKKPSNKN